MTVDSEGVGTFSGSLNGNGDRDPFGLSLPAGECTVEVFVTNLEAVAGMHVQKFCKGQQSGSRELGRLTIGDFFNSISLSPAEGYMFKVFNAKDQVPGASGRTPRELESMLLVSGLVDERLAVDEMIMLLEEEDYSKHQIVRAQNETTLRSYSRVVGDR